MDYPAHATLVAIYQDGTRSVFPVQFNPGEFTLEKGSHIAEVGIPGLDSPLLQFVRGLNEKLSVDLFFDTTDTDNPAAPVSVTTLTDLVYALMKIEPKRHAPPICEFIWNRSFPGCDLPPAAGNQRRASFPCIVESVRQK